MITDIGSDGTLTIDLLATIEQMNKSLVGLVTGCFLTIRSKRNYKGQMGTVRSCPNCCIPASQEQFLNSCPVNLDPRRILRSSLPSRFQLEYFEKGDFHSFYRGVRRLRVLVANPIYEEDPFSSELLQNLAKATFDMAALFVSNVLSLFN